MRSGRSGNGVLAAAAEAFSGAEVLSPEPNAPALKSAVRSGSASGACGPEDRSAKRSKLPGPAAGPPRRTLCFYTDKQLSRWRDVQQEASRGSQYGFGQPLPNQ